MSKKSDKKDEKKKKAKKTERKSRASRSGKYKSMRHMMEAMFYKNQNLTSDEAMKMVKKEFPDSAYVKSNHFPWYHTHIVNLREFTVIEPPKWAKGGAKIKKHDKKEDKADKHDKHDKHDKKDKKKDKKKSKKHDDE
jgi:hypothetical protein